MSAQTCTGCRDGAALDFDFTMAFQPVVDPVRASVFAYEALVRGTDGAGAGAVLAQVTEANRYAFDQQCRVRAIELAAKLGLADTGAVLSINFLPSAVYEPNACIRLTLAAARRVGFPLNRIMFEFTENEHLDHAHARNIIETYKGHGFLTALDDFGAGFSGLGLLANFQPDMIKLDMDLIRGLDRDAVRRALVEAMVRACAKMGVRVIAEGIETEGEAATLAELGVELMQGYLFARPGFEILPAPAWPSRTVSAAA